MNTLVSFEIAKLLKEKGFDKSLDTIFNTVYDIEDMSLMKNVHHDTLIKGKGLFLHAPTIAEVVMWLYEKHRIWISVYTMETWPNGNERKQLFDYSLKQMRFGLIDIPKKPEEYNSPTEAYEASIEYTLKNLI